MPERLLVRKRRTHIRQGFWRTSLNYLEILESARARWRAAMKRHHPDRGGCPHRAAALNAAWHRIRRLFAARGYALD